MPQEHDEQSPSEDLFVPTARRPWYKRIRFGPWRYERKSLVANKAEYDRAMWEEDVRSRRHERHLRWCMFVLLVAWLVGVGLVVVAHGSQNYPFELDATPLSVVIGSGGAQVVALLLLVAAYVFPRRKRIEDLLRTQGNGKRDEAT